MTVGSWNGSIIPQISITEWHFKALPYKMSQSLDLGSSCPVPKTACVCFSGSSNLNNCVIITSTRKCHPAIRTEEQPNWTNLFDIPILRRWVLFGHPDPQTVDSHRSPLLLTVSDKGHGGRGFPHLSHGDCSGATEDPIVRRFAQEALRPEWLDQGERGLSGCKLESYMGWCRWKVWGYQGLRGWTHKEKNPCILCSMDQSMEVQWKYSLARWGDD